MIFTSKDIILDHQYGNRGYRFIKSTKIRTYKAGDALSQQRALKRALQDKIEWEKKQPKRQIYIPLKALFNQ